MFLLFDAAVILLKEVETAFYEKNLVICTTNGTS